MLMMSASFAGCSGSSDPDSEIIHRVETNCDSSSVEVYHEMWNEIEYIFFEGIVDIDDGVWEYTHNYDSVVFMDSEDSEYISLEATCQDENSNGNTPWVKVSVFVNGNLLATADEYDDNYANCDVLVTLYANYETSVHREKCYHD